MFELVWGYERGTATNPFYHFHSRKGFQTCHWCGPVTCPATMQFLKPRCSKQPLVPQNRSGLVRNPRPRPPPNDSGPRPGAWEEDITRVMCAMRFMSVSSTLFVLAKSPTPHTPRFQRTDMKSHPAPPPLTDTPKQDVPQPRRATNSKSNDGQQAISCGLLRTGDQMQKI